jgi:putative redox protein
MNPVTTTWQGGLEFKVDFPYGETFTLTSVPAAKRPGPGPSPMEAVQAALAGCTGIDVVMILTKMRKKPQSVRITVDGERRAEEPRIYTRLTVTYHVDGPAVDEAAVRRAVALSEDKYCSVSAMLRPVVALDHRIVLNGRELDPAAEE